MRAFVAVLSGSMLFALVHTPATSIRHLFVVDDLGRQHFSDACSADAMRLNWL